MMMLVPIDVTDDGITSVIRLLQASNAAKAIAVTDVGILILVTGQPPNMNSVILVTLVGIVADDSASNVYFFIPVTVYEVSDGDDDDDDDDYDDDDDDDDDYYDDYDDNDCGDNNNYDDDGGGGVNSNDDDNDDGDDDDNDDDSTLHELLTTSKSR